MPMTHPPTETQDFDYDVALSFAEEDRAFAKCVAVQLKKRKLRVYYDKHHELDMLGENLYPLLYDIYRYRSRYCIIFISQHYIRKNWTLHELAAAQARALVERKPYIFYFRHDNTEIAGVSNNIKCFLRDEYDCIQFTETIAEKIGQPEQLPMPPVRPVSKKPLKTYWPKRFSRKFLSEKVRYFFSGTRRSVSMIVLTGGISALVATDKLTPVEVLAERIHEKSRWTKFVQCRDGQRRLYRGRGTCSYHGGIDTSMHVDSVAYTKTMEQCRKEAATTSWLPP